MQPTSPEPVAPPMPVTPVPTRRSFLRTVVAAVSTIVVIGSPAGAAAKKTTKKVTKKTAKTATTKAPAASNAATAGSGSAAFPGTEELVIGFTYTAADSGGRIRNPYVAVWIEDISGASLRTLQLSYQSGKGLRWLPNLRRWYQADQVRQISGGTDLLGTISSATRLPALRDLAGAYSVAWNGLDDRGGAIAVGDYVLCVEAAREKGPYSLLKEKFAVGSGR